MTRLSWNAPGERNFEAGLDRGVLYPGAYTGYYGVAWNGLISVAEDPSGGDVEPIYYDGIKVADLVSSEDYQATITAFSAPPEFGVCEGREEIAPGLFVGNQRRQPFSFSYRTLKGNDLVGTELGYKIHLVWNCTAAPGSRTRKTLAQTTEPEQLTWVVHTVPPRDADYFRPTAHMVIDTTHLPEEKVNEIESYLYGDVEFAPRLPDQSELIQILGNTTEVE